MLSDLINQELRLVLKLLMLIYVIEEVLPEYFMPEDLVPANPLALLQLQTSLDERFHRFRNLDATGEYEWLGNILE